ncbi:MAG: GIY-YIG nuclease family protein [Acidobacteriaceae bacterium]|nr:GIY-YIG nuclease family protein [Acidobacteriaceae bacterium]
MREERTFFVYIVASRSRTLYLGFTNDLHRRVWEHKNKIRDGFSANYNCDRLVWYESFALAVEGIPREKQIKRWNRAKKLALIAAMNPAWIDLAEEWYK